MKKIINKIFLFILCTAILFSSFGVYKVEGRPVQATYSPWTAAGGSDPFGEQGQYPWCIMLCFKIVLRDINDKYPGGGAPAAINMGNINTLINTPDPDPAHTVDKLIIQEELVKKLLLEHKARTDFPFVSTILGEKNQFDTAVNTFFDGLTGHFCDPACANPHLCDEIRNANDYRRDSLFNGLLGCSGATLVRLQTLWTDLGAIRELRRNILGESTDDIINMINTFTDSGAGGGIGATVHSVLSGDAVDMTVYNRALKTILNTELNNRKMVIINLRDPNNHDSKHSCVAYSGELLSTNPGLDPPAAPGGVGEKINVYNPWGEKFSIDNSDPGPVCDVYPRVGGLGIRMEIYEYITFNY
ncbi:MAG: hypothetical protein LBF82_03020 [Lactobacillales bacterium]|jgi:hypothetical protein|nr:hypothetical protein [Lactobacillales bacterium]